MRVFDDLDLSRLLIVDNSVSNFIHHLDNGIPIFPFDGSDNEDKELPKLATYLKWLISKGDNMIKENSEYFKLYVGLRTPEIHRVFHDLFGSK